MQVNSQTIGILNAARTLLVELAKEAQAEASELRMNGDPAIGSGEADQADLGRFAEALERADDAIFHALNTGNAHCKLELTDGQLHNR